MKYTYGFEGGKQDADVVGWNLDEDLEARWRRRQPIQAREEGDKVGNFWIRREECNVSIEVKEKIGDFGERANQECLEKQTHARESIRFVNELQKSKEVCWIDNPIDVGI